MVRCLGEMLYDTGFHTGIQGCGGDDFLKQGSVYSPRAGERDQDSPGAQKFKGQQVDILVAAGSLISLCGGGGELGWIKNDQVEGAGLVAEFTQDLENISFQHVKPVNREIV